MRTFGGNKRGTTNGKLLYSFSARMAGSILMLAMVATVALAQRRGTADRPSQLHIHSVNEPNGQILSYRYLAASTDVTMRGTAIAPEAHIRLKVGSRPGFVELDINRGQITGLKPASQFGLDYLTYVLWAVSVDGKAANLGEITFVDDKPISINVTTPYQTFWLMLTAEPNYAVVDPSPLVVLYSTNENPGKPAAEKTAQTISGTLFFYTHYGDYDRKPTSPDRAPNPLLQARKAVELASKSGILATGSSKAPEGEEARTREALKKARDFLDRAEKAYKENPDGNDVAQFSRTAAQIAENARALALGAVGGALVNQLEREVERLKTELVSREADVPPTSPLEPPAPSVPAVSVAPPSPPAGTGELAATFVEAIAKPLTWVGVAGWGLAVLLLFRRRSI
jgi:hypothetical protein